ncbi:MAG: amidohydrolase family protein [Chitinophagales bacterium]|nr:amidohydrolase family protein [Chitinophagales bacterium]
MRYLTADCIFSLRGPAAVNSVVVAASDGRIEALLPEDEVDPLLVERHRGVLCPGFVNAHCHLELSHLHDQIPSGTGLPFFLNALARLRRAQGADAAWQEAAADAMKRADECMQREGIVAVADISNTDSSFGVKQTSSLTYYTFVECLGLAVGQIAERIQNAQSILLKARQQGLVASLTPHAPYTVSPLLLKSLFMEDGTGIYSVHYMESEAERQLLTSGSGALQDLLPLLAVERTYFSDQPVQWPEVMIDLLPSGSRVLLVHNTIAQFEDLSPWLQWQGSFWLCTCPDANQYIEGSLPDYALWRKVTNRICIGTDSLASNKHLSILEAMKSIQAHDPDVGLEDLLRWACCNGAACLGWDELGTLEPGKRPGINCIAPVDLAHGRLLPESRVSRLV